jgi:hypothetical protein
MSDAPIDSSAPVVSTTTVSTTTTNYSLLGTDGVTIACSVLNDNVQVTSDDINGNANALFRVTSLPALIAILQAIQAATPPAS